MNKKGNIHRIIDIEIMGGKTLLDQTRGYAPASIMWQFVTRHFEEHDCEYTFMFGLRRMIPQEEEIDALFAEVKRFYSEYVYKEYETVDNLNEILNKEIWEAEEEIETKMPSPKSEVRKKKGFVYLLKCGDAHKIGETKNISNRILQISPVMPYDVEFICAIEADDVAKEEAYWHELYSPYRLNGEWFDLRQNHTDMFYACSQIKELP